MITFEPIGVIRTPYQRFYDAPRQPGVDEVVDSSVVELLPGKNYEQALQDLDGCDRIWLVVHFHQAQTWKPKVLPPRGRT
ncbi:MAG: tRNA (N6-threonylcarbamoyladenosine(37)-N6)-methyltransferase TrmO, partial [Cyclobacteriaceae bacterium]|nr:tRNA (N6-threonylcarbamoyladenosine(37)-N6)-methyltransferase TrmO [Cyclobacteriaceae bacterium]